MPLPTIPEPKPTLYSGVHFKSRLEARWAVLFDALSIPWEYEAITFSFSPQNWQYTPDFRLNPNVAPQPSPTERLKKRASKRRAVPLPDPTRLILLEVKPALPEPGIFRALELIESASTYATALGVGSFFKETPRMYFDPKVSMSLTDWIKNTLGKTGGVAQRATLAASHYRFDLA